jgi:hypothetical protein
MPQVIFAVFIICHSVCVMVHLYCQCDEIYGHLGETVFIRLIEVIPAHCEWHHSLYSGLEEAGERQDERGKRREGRSHHGIEEECAEEEKGEPPWVS